jgi:hypothetical protein
VSLSQRGVKLLFALRMAALSVTMCRAYGAGAASWVISLRSDVATARPRVFPLTPILVQRWENETLCPPLFDPASRLGEILFG